MNVEEHKFTKYEFGSACTIYEAAQLHQDLEELLQKDFVVELDVSAIESTDASFIQLLAASHMQAVNKGVELKITGRSAPLSEFTEKIHCQEVLDSDVIRSAIEVIHDES